MAQLDRIKKGYNQNGIPLRVVEYSMQGSDGKVLDREMNFAVRYPKSNLMKLIRERAPGLEDDLLDHLLCEYAAGRTTHDERRIEAGFREELEDERKQERVREGVGQVHGKKSSAYREYKGIPIPSFIPKSWCNFNLALRKKLYWLFHLVAEEVKKEHPGAFGDDLRQEIFGEMVRDGMGCDENDPIFPWEYFDILVTCDTGLSKHCDHLNDWRPGYAHTSVYSYHCVIKGAEYKVSIIMTTRRAVGSAMVRIRKELNLK